MAIRSRRQVARTASSSWPPRRLAASNSTTLWPRSAATRAASSPAGPPPTTTTLRPGCGEGGTICGRICSRPVAGLWMQASFLYMQCEAPTQGRMRSSSPRISLLTICGSAMCARVIATMSSRFSAMAWRAVAMSGMRAAWKTGSPTSRRKAPTLARNGASGCDMPGMLCSASDRSVSMRPKMALKKSTWPSRSNSRARRTHSSKPMPSSMSSSITKRMPTM